MNTSTNPASLSLLPDRGIILSINGSVAPDLLVKFADNFRATWQKVPEGDRRKLIAHWDYSGEECSEVYPAIWLIEQMPREIEGGDTFGRCDLGCLFEFAARCIRILPDSLLQALIAHELAHAIQCANRTAMTEDGADHIAAEWGFPIREFRRRFSPAI